MYPTNSILRDDLQTYRSSQLPPHKPSFRPSNSISHLDDSPVAPRRKQHPSSSSSPTSPIHHPETTHHEPHHNPHPHPDHQHALRQHHLRALHDINPSLLRINPDSHIDNRTERIQEYRSKQLQDKLTSELSKQRALREFEHRYERRFHPSKWKHLAELVTLIQSTSELRFSSSLDRCFKRVLFRSSSTSLRCHPVQRVGLEELLHVVANNYSGTGTGTGNDMKLDKGPHRGRTTRELIVQQIVTLMKKIFYYFDVYQVTAESSEEMLASDQKESAGVVGPSTCNASDVSESFIDPRELLCAMRVISHPGLNAGEDHLRYW